jgi:hypothetical protein
LGAFRLWPVWPVRFTGLTGVEPLSESCPVSPAGTGLTGGAHRFDQCWSVDSRFSVPLRSRVGRVCVCWFLGPVATWARPTWVVSRRRVLEAVFILLEFPSPSRRIFIGFHWLPPLWFAVSVLQRPARINCRWNVPSLTSGAHHDRGGRITAPAPSSRRGNQGVAAGGHVRLPTPPTTRAAAAPEKARPQRVT